MTAALFFSGGKDSYWCLEQLEGNVELITTIDREARRVPIQGIRAEVIEAQADALSRPLRLLELPPLCDNRTYVQSIRKLVQHQGYDRLVFGDLHLQEIRDFRERQFGDLGVELVFPLWGRDTATLARAMIEGGVDARLCSVNRAAVSEELLGHRFDPALLDKLPKSVDPCGERGEFHTVVLGGPGMAPLTLVEGEQLDHLGHRLLDYELP